MTLRVCAEDSCPVLTDTTRCVSCTRAKDKARGSREARGYDHAHRKLRVDYQQRMDRGESFTCWRCAADGRPHAVDPNDWQLGHDDHDRSTYRGPECSAGNQATAGRRSTGPAA